MTEFPPAARSPDATRPGDARMSGWLSLVLNLAGVVLIGVGSLQTSRDGLTPPVLVATGLALAAWTARAIVLATGRTGIPIGVAAAMALPAAYATVDTDGVAAVMLVLALLAVFGDRRHSLVPGVVLATLSTVTLIASLAVRGTIAPPGVLGLAAAIVLPTVAGIARRRYRQAEDEARTLRERDILVEAHSARLADRQAVARDIHDVLAHSLGGLVIQLDAVEALLEAGRTADAARRVADARRLAASGLEDARRAVTSLRDPDAGGSATPLTDSLPHEVDELAAEHRRIGGTATFAVIGFAQPVEPRIADAMRRGVQEALTNARKHAPEQPVDLVLMYSEGRVEAEVKNSLKCRTPAGSIADLAATGSGRGLSGLRERFASIPTAVVDVSADGRGFILKLSAPSGSAAPEGTAERPAGSIPRGSSM